MWKCPFHIQNPSIALATLGHMINVYEICLNTTNYPIFNMQDFRYCLWTSILDCFGQLVSPPCSVMAYIRAWVYGLVMMSPHRGSSTNILGRSSLWCYDIYQGLGVLIGDDVSTQGKLHKHSTMQLALVSWHISGLGCLT